MLIANHIFSLNSECLHLLANGLGADLIDERFVILPEDVGEGGFFFTEVAPGLSVIMCDIIYKTPVLLRRIKSENELYIIHFDFSDEMNLIHIDGLEHKIGYKTNLGLGVFDNVIENSYEPVVGERVFAMRLLVSKDLLDESIVNRDLKDLDKRKIKKLKNTLFFYDHIDSESKLILHSIKSKSFHDPGFQIYLQGVSLRLLARFIKRYSNLAPMLYHISEKEAEMINLSKEYLVNNLSTGFPGVDFLAEKAGMSVTKYKSLFKKMYVDTPSNFFIREKMIFAKELLKSEYYDSIGEILKELNYSNLTALSRPYIKYFNSKPLEDFIKS